MSGAFTTPEFFAHPDGQGISGEIVDRGGLDLVIAALGDGTALALFRGLSRTIKGQIFPEEEGTT